MCRLRHRVLIIAIAAHGGPAGATGRPEHGDRAHHLTGLTVPELAGRMEKTVVSVTGLLYRGSKSLRQPLNESRRDIDDASLSDSTSSEQRPLAALATYYEANADGTTPNPRALDHARPGVRPGTGRVFALEHEIHDLAAPIRGTRANAGHPGPGDRAGRWPGGGSLPEPRTRQQRGL